MLQQTCTVSTDLPHIPALLLTNGWCECKFNSFDELGSKALPVVFVSL